MRKIKILTVTTSGLAKKEGISTVILDYYSHFDKSKFDLDIIVSGEYSYELVKAFQNIGVSIRCLPSRKYSFPKYIKSFIKLIQEQKYDALYIHGSSAIMSVELLLTWLGGCKIRVVHSHNTTCDHRRADRFLRPIFYHLYTQALACGSDAGKWLYGNRKFTVIKNGRDLNTYRYNSEIRKIMRRNLCLEDDTLAIGHVGNFNEQKNQRFLIDVIDNLQNRSEKAKLFLMGDGRTKSNIEQLVRKRKLDDYVVFTGSVSNVSEMLQAMDVMVLPSLYEGLPLVAIEWQIAALPCIFADSITKECAYTEQVKFLPLSVGGNGWAEEILSWRGFEREIVANQCVELTKTHGYAIEENADKLQSIFIR